MYLISVVIYSIMYMYILYVIILGLCVVRDVEFYIVIEFNGCIEFFLIFFIKILKKVYF